MKINGNIIAHRGIHDNKTIPENSLKAFKKAIELNYPIELDVQLTKDNVLVVFHDFNLTRMANRNDFIQDMYFENIKNITLLDSEEKIPTFKEVLKIVNEKVMLDIEIKNTKKIEEVCEILFKELSNFHNYIVKSFNPKIVRYIKDNYPNVEVGLLITNNTKNLFYDKLLTSSFVLKYAKPDFIAISKDLLKSKKFKKLSNKITTLVWTIKNKSEINNPDLIYICNNLPFDNR